MPFGFLWWEQSWEFIFPHYLGNALLNIPCYAPEITGFPLWLRRIQTLLGLLSSLRAALFRCGSSDSDVVFSQAEDLLAPTCNLELAVPHWNFLHITSVSQRLDLTTRITRGRPRLPALSPHRGGGRAPLSSPAHKAAWRPSPGRKLRPM